MKKIVDQMGANLESKFKKDEATEEEKVELENSRSFWNSL